MHGGLLVAPQSPLHCWPQPPRDELPVLKAVAHNLLLFAPMLQGLAHTASSRLHGLFQWQDAYILIDVCAMLWITSPPLHASIASGLGLRGTVPPSDGPLQMIPMLELMVVECCGRMKVNGRRVCGCGRDRDKYLEKGCSEWGT